MKTKLGILLICLCALIRPSCGQVSGNSNSTKKVAILEVTNPDGDMKNGDLLMILGTLTNAVTGMPGYKGYERTDIGQILGEHNFQRTGMVSDAQIKRIGEMESAQYVLASVAARMSNGKLAITAKMLDVETAEVSQNAVVQTTMEDLEKGCLELVGKLFSKGTYGNGVGYGVQTSGSNVDAVLSNTEKEIYILGLKGNVEEIEEISNYRIITSEAEEYIPSAEADNGLFDGNLFLVLVFGDEHGARLPFNYLLFYCTNVSFRFNKAGRIASLISNSEQGGFISFYYDSRNNLIKQDATNNVSGNQNEGTIRYIEGCMVDKYSTEYCRKATSDGGVVLSGGGLSSTISFNGEHRISRMYLPDYWDEGKPAEYIFEYNSKGWPSRIISRTGKKGRGQIITKFIYSDMDANGNWTRRKASIDYWYYDERAKVEVDTERKITYSE